MYFVCSCRSGEVQPATGFSYRYTGDIDFDVVGVDLHMFTNEKRRYVSQ